MSIWIVEQFGFAIILSLDVRRNPLISGMISLTLLSILQAEELSITYIPLSLNIGAHLSETSAPAENKATSIFSLMDVSIEITRYFSPLNSIELPSDFFDATGVMAQAMATK